MRRLAVFMRQFVLILAVAAYTANGAQAHLSVDHGETISILVCSERGDRMVDIAVGGGGVEEDTGSCCGDCVAGLAPGSAAPVRTGGMITWAAMAVPSPAPIYPGSPLWPGAPPQGPPATRKA